jgi:hypothetical protein
MHSPADAVIHPYCALEEQKFVTKLSQNAPLSSSTTRLGYCFTHCATYVTIQGHCTPKSITNSLWPELPNFVRKLWCLYRHSTSKDSSRIYLEWWEDLSGRPTQCPNLLVLICHILSMAVTICHLLHKGANSRTGLCLSLLWGDWWIICFLN